MEPIRDPEVLARMRVTFDLYQTAVDMMRQNLRRRHVIQLQRDRDVRNRPALDRRLPQRQSLPLAEAAEYRIDEGAVGHLGFEIGSPVRVATKADERTLVQLPPAKGIETVIAGYGQ